MRGEGARLFEVGEEDEIMAQKLGAYSEEGAYKSVGAYSRKCSMVCVQLEKNGTRE